MEEEEEDQLLLSSLGVTSANPEDIEHDLLIEASKNKLEFIDNPDSTEADYETTTDHDASPTPHVELHSKLRAIQFEINAVAASVCQGKDVLGNKDHDYDTSEGENVLFPSHESSSELTLQHALAADRIKSLENTKARIEKELLGMREDCLLKDSDSNDILQDLVKVELAPKRRFSQGKKPVRDLKRRKNAVSVTNDGDFESVLDAASSGFVETEREELIRKGVLTPFHKITGFERRLEEPAKHNGEKASEEVVDHSIDRAVRLISEAVQARPTTKLLDVEDAPKLEPPSCQFHRLKKPLNILECKENEGEELKVKRKNRRPLPGRKWRRFSSNEEKFMEHGKLRDVDEGEVDTEEDYITLEGGLKIPSYMFSNLFDYQKVGVQWLWELHCQRAGGIIGDEMGLGKTIQVLSFLGALHFSEMYKPSIVICPVTLLRQWKREAEKWYPSFHIEILHDSALNHTKLKPVKPDGSDKESDESLSSDVDEKSSDSNMRKWDSLVRRVLESQSGLLITTYEQLRILGEKLLDIEWGYAVLDEGHRIRNPNAEITLICKQLQTVHRIIMTGAPIQNKLTELWSLFDFVFPGKLGVLPVFEAEFAVPISVGGYANASPLQVSTAYRCAVVLRDLIMPYLLRRMKADVSAKLPKKTEHVIFCSLTPEQRSVYRAFLASSEVEQIFSGSRNSLYGIDVMRKICNHPDLLEREHSLRHPDYGNPDRSGKMKVVGQVLRAWKDNGHRVLLFAQTQQMLDIIENYLVSCRYNYRRMDGRTPVGQRMALMDEFNSSDAVFIFILTTRVGGLGTNLTGANRVIIFDPDWNPSTDMQARERAWRIGQEKDVTVYRLITRGTIEEKVYHRQIYKHFLTNKVLKNPQQTRFFRARDMKDLFTLNDDEAGSTETSNIFSKLSDDVTVIGTEQHEKSKQNVSESCDISESISGMTSESCPGKKGSPDMGDTEVDQEAHFLKSLFDAHGIHSAMDHDAIMNAHDEEKLRLEEQAAQVAQRAAEALRQSRMLRSGHDISIPTWTGNLGEAGAPLSARRKFGSTPSPHPASRSKPAGVAAGVSAGKALSSAELLAHIRQNQEKAIGDGLEHQFTLPSTSTAAEAGPSKRAHGRPASRSQPEVLIRQICSFMQQRGGSCSSTSIVDSFKERVVSEDLPLFKNLLKEIASLQKGLNGSVWVLKSEYQKG